MYDFLSLFAYVDAFGSTFKTRGRRDMPKGVGRAKQFTKEQLVYRVSSYPEFCAERDLTLSQARRYLIRFNQFEQLREADTVRGLIGEEKMGKYLSSKDGIDAIAIRHLGSIAKKVKIS